MRILHIAPLPSHANGINTVVQELAKSQQELGNDVIVWRGLKNGDRSFPFIGDFSNIHEEIDSIKPNIVIFHSVYLWPYLKIGKYLNKKKIPYLVQLHGALSKHNYRKGYLKKLIANIFFFEGFIKRAAAIVYLNNVEQRDAIVHKWNSKYIIVPNGCKLQIEPLDTPPRSSDTQIKFLFIGRIDINHKGLDLLAQALEILNTPENAKKIKFEIFGVGDRRNLAKLQDLLTGLDDIVEFKGAIYGNEKRMKMQSSDVFIHTSRYEGMPMSVLEALACGMPCILTPGTNMAEMVVESNCGWATEPVPSKIASMILKITEIIHDEENILKENAIALAGTFSWEMIAQESVKKYSEIIIQSN